MNNLQLNPKIEADSTYVVDLSLCQVRLHNNAAFPWIMLIPNTKVIEIIDLSESDQQLLMREICQASSVMRLLFDPKKLNIASIGNAVSQIHVHVVARYDSDAAWPKTVWYCGIESEYKTDEKQKRIESIRLAFDKLLTS